MQEEHATVDALDFEGNAIYLKDASRVIQARANHQGRIYTSSGLAGDWFEYAVKMGGVITSEEGQHTDEDPGDVVLHDIVDLGRGEVYVNGTLHLGKPFADQVVTVAMREIENPDKSETETEEITPKVYS